MHLTNLPPELLQKLPYHLHSLDDWYALIRTSTYLYTTCSTTKATFPPTFAHNRPLTPHPQFVLAGSARQIADWAAECDENYQRVCAAFPKGNEALLEIAGEVARWSVSDVRRLHREKVEVVLPLMRILDVDDELDVWAEDLPPVDVLTALYNYLIYCDLFHHSIDGAYIVFPDYIKPLWRKNRIEWMLHSMQSPQTPVYKANFGVWLRTHSDVDRLITSTKWLNDQRMELGSLESLQLASLAEGFSHAMRFERVIRSQGLHTLRLMLPNVHEATIEHIGRFRKEIEKVDEDGRLEDWYSLESDCSVYETFGLCGDETCPVVKDVASSTLRCQHHTTVVNFGS